MPGHHGGPGPRGLWPVTRGTAPPARPPPPHPAAPGQGHGGPTARPSKEASGSGSMWSQVPDSSKWIVTRVVLWTGTAREDGNWLFIMRSKKPAHTRGWEAGAFSPLPMRELPRRRGWGRSASGVHFDPLRLLVELPLLGAPWGPRQQECPAPLPQQPTLIPASRFAQRLLPWDPQPVGREEIPHTLSPLSQEPLLPGGTGRSQPTSPHQLWEEGHPGARGGIHHTGRDPRPLTAASGGLPAPQGRAGAGALTQLCPLRLPVPSVPGSRIAIPWVGRIPAPASRQGCSSSWGPWHGLWKSRAGAWKVQPRGRCEPRVSCSGPESHRQRTPPRPQPRPLWTPQTCTVGRAKLPR